ncbi:hypothetical protein RIF29_07074 [Crotalaria pallida]|uniref:Secreted protein n=1 Tax=Crotalaria pallida TaxID=3830 RepID=A0AAN9PBV7_CROPI
MVALFLLTAPSVVVFGSCCSCRPRPKPPRSAPPSSFTPTLSPPLADSNRCRHHFWGHLRQSCSVLPPQHSSTKLIQKKILQ